MATVTSLAAFAHAERASHVIVNSRKRTSVTTWPLRNGIFDVVDLPPDASENELHDARCAIGERRAIVIDERDERAENACARLSACGANVMTLEDGLLGWTQAVVYERTDRHGDATVTSFLRPARMLRTYVVVTPMGLTIVDGCGSATLLLHEAESIARLPSAIVDTAYHRDRISCGAECARRAETTYWLPPAGEDRIDARLRRRLEATQTIAGLVVTPVHDGRNLRLDGIGFSIGSHHDATYPTCCGPESHGSTTYDAVNRGISLVDEGRRWQLEFGPPGCLPA